MIERTGDQKRRVTVPKGKDVALFDVDPSPNSQGDSESDIYQRRAASGVPAGLVSLDPPKPRVRLLQRELLAGLEGLRRRRGEAAGRPLRGRRHALVVAALVRAELPGEALVRDVAERVCAAVL